MAQYDREGAISKFVRTHSQGYDYTEFQFKSMGAHSTFRCEIHGEFETTPEAFLRAKTPCSVCRTIKTNKVWVAKFNEAHDGRLIATPNGMTKVKVSITCAHGTFEVWKTNAARGDYTGCPYCVAAVRKRAMAERIIPRFQAVHGERYDYSKFEYKGMLEKATVVCRKHGPFLVTPGNHESQRSGCSSCTSNASSREETLWMDALEKELGEPIVRGKRFGNVVREVDGIIGNVILEYDGAYWHHSKENHDRDTTKVRRLTDMGYSVIRLRAHSKQHPLMNIPGADNFKVPDRGVSPDVVRSITQRIKTLRKANNV